MRGPHFHPCVMRLPARNARHDVSIISQGADGVTYGASHFFFFLSLSFTYIFSDATAYVSGRSRDGIFFSSPSRCPHTAATHARVRLLPWPWPFSLSFFLSLSQLTDWLQIVIIECVYAYEWANLDHFSVWNGESLRRRSRCINQSSSPLCACQGGDGVWVKYLIHFGISLLRDDRSTTFTVRWISIVGPTEKN